MQGAVTAKRVQAEAYLIDSISDVPQSAGCHGCGHRLLRGAGLATSPSLLDLLAAASHGPEYLLRFNPFLSQQSCQRLYDALLLWLQLCVLEDRLGRLHRLAQAAGRDTALLPMLVQELSIRRVYDVKQHPWWLVFEVEGQFQVGGCGSSTRLPCCKC
jgi:hypothetical protein